MNCFQIVYMHGQKKKWLAHISHKFKRPIHMLNLNIHTLPMMLPLYSIEKKKKHALPPLINDAIISAASKNLNTIKDFFSFISCLKQRFLRHWEARSCSLPLQGIYKTFFTIHVHDKIGVIFLRMRGTEKTR